MNIAFDLDSTLVDLIKPIKRIFKKQKIKYFPTTNWNFSNYPFCIRVKVFELFLNKKIMCKLKPFYNSQKLIKQLIKDNHTISIITARHDNISEDTNKFVEKLFNVPCYIVKPNQSKLDIIKQLDVELWVDDCPNNLIEYQNNGIECIMISNKNTVYNHHLRDKLFHVQNINELFKYYKFLKKQKRL